MVEGFRRHVLVVVSVLVVSATVAGCTGGRAPDGVLTVPQAVDLSRDPATVRGFVVVGHDGVAKFCEGMLGSYPPQCGGAAIELRDLKTSGLPGVETDQGVTWTGEITLTGALSDGVLTLR